MKQFFRNQSGLTLVELMVVSTVTGMLIFIIMSVTSRMLVDNAVINARSDALLEAQIALDNIGRDIRLSANVDEHNRWEDDNAPGGSDPYSWESNDSTLILATAALDSNKNIIFSDPLHYITSKNNNIYFVQNGTLFKRILADPTEGNAATTTCPPDLSDNCPDDRELIHDVKNFSVRYFNNQNEEVEPALAQSIELTIVIETVKYNQTITTNYTTRTVFRNE